VTEPVPPRIKVEAVGGTSRRLLSVIVLTSAVLVVLTLKPWDSHDEPVPEESRPLAVSETTAQPQAAESNFPAEATPLVATQVVPDELAAARARALCGSEPEWRLLTMETGPLGTSRTLYSDVPAIATGPADQAIPTVAVTAPQLLGIGVCRPGVVDGHVPPTPVTGVTIWNVSAEGGPLMLSGIVVIDPDLSRLGEAYFRPLATDGSTAGTANTAWGPGRYAIEIAGAAPDGRPLWLGLDYLAS